MRDLAGRLCVVAGAGGGGIGTEACAMLAEAGAHVLALDIDADGCALIRSILGKGGGSHMVA